MAGFIDDESGIHFVVHQPSEEMDSGFRPHKARAAPE
jgi:hypothetical protein